MTSVSYLDGGSLFVDANRRRKLMCVCVDRDEIFFNDLNVLLTSKSRQARLIKKNKEDKQRRNDVKCLQIVNDNQRLESVYTGAEPPGRRTVLVDNMPTYKLAASFTFLQIFVVGLEVLNGREREVKMGYLCR